MEDGFGVVLMLDGLYIVADGIHIPEHRADKVDTLLVDGDNISSIGIGPSRFDCKHSDNICPVGDGKVAAAIRLSMNYHTVRRVLSLYLVDFRRKLTVDERHRLRHRLGIAVIARPEHTEWCPDDRRRTADDQNHRNERTGTAQQSDCRPCNGLSCANDCFLNPLKEFYCAFGGLRCLLRGFLHNLLLHPLLGSCCDLRLCLGRRLLARSGILPSCE